jgi:glycosyltransferase involved in cell wall biosynthesis
MQTISIIIPAYNAERFLKDALDSVSQQKCDEAIEIIVVDDGSMDGTADIATNYESVVYLKQEHLGVSQARNAGMLRCRGDFIAYLDADDLYVENKLALQMEVLRNNSEVHAVFGHISEFVTPGESLDHHRKPVSDAPCFIAGTILMRRSFAEMVGPFDTSLRFGEFIDWYSRARAKGLRDVMLPEVVLKRRMHANNTTLTAPPSAKDYARALKAHLVRSRETSN